MSDTLHSDEETAAALGVSVEHYRAVWGVFATLRETENDMEAMDQVEFRNWAGRVRHGIKQATERTLERHRRGEDLE